MSELSESSQHILQDFRRHGVGEIKIALITQALGVAVFVTAAIIYGLITIPSPSPGDYKPVSLPTDYQLTPEPVAPLRENPTKPPMISNVDDAEHIQVVSAIASRMTSSIIGRQVEYISRSSLPEKSAGARLPLWKIKEVPSSKLLDWTLDIPPLAVIRFNATSATDAGELLKNIIAGSKETTAPQVFMVTVMNPPEGIPPASWTPVSFGLVKDSQRLLFVDSNSKVSEVFDTGEKPAPDAVHPAADGSVTPSPRPQ